MGQAAKPVVLLVEDEPLTRMDACTALPRYGVALAPLPPASLQSDDAFTMPDAGFEVLDAPDAEVALALVRERPDIAVMVTDIQMPGLMDGLKLARVVCALRPRMRIVITSGGLRLGADDLPCGAAFLPKPYAVDGLARRLSIARPLPHA